MTRFPHPYTPADADAWVRQFAGQDPSTQGAIEVGGEAVGGIGVTLQEDVHRRAAEIGYWLGSVYEGRGVITEAVGAMLGFLFDDYAVNRVVIRAAVANVRK